MIDIEIRNDRRIKELSSKIESAIRQGVQDVADKTNKAARSNSPVGKTGKLSKSWRQVQIGELKHSIFTNLFYARWVNDGTGIYGSGRPITPKRARFLRFEWHGRIVFARSVRGQKGKKFAEETTTEMNGRARRIVESAIKRAGIG
jgi:hypothetical protein